MTEPVAGSVPDETLAAAIAGSVVGHAPTEMHRFTTGSRHYVFEARFLRRDPVVVRIGDRSACAEMEGARRLSGLLRPRGVPPTPFLHDTTTKNVIVAPDGRLSGIVDVDDLCFGDPRYAAALTLAVLTGYGGPTRYVSAWPRHAGETDDPVFRLYVAVFLLDLMGEHGQLFNGNERPSAPEARASLREAFEATYRRLAA